MSKVAVITGASKGIGAATAIAFAQDGYNVVVNYLSDKVAAEKIVKIIEESGNKAIIVQADVYTEQGVKKLFQGVSKGFGRLDVLVSNAGFIQEPAFGEWTQAKIAESFTCMFASAALCTQAAVPLMEKHGGSILYTSSVNGLNFGGNPGVPLYSAAKAAIINFAQSMAERLAPNIRCNVVVPGTTRTPFWDDKDPVRAQKNLDMTLQKEWVGPAEIATAFVFLAKTPHMNAQTIVVDAGWQKKSRTVDSK